MNADWWETATVEDVEAEIAKGADVNADIYVMVDVDETYFACQEGSVSKLSTYA